MKIMDTLNGHNPDVVKRINKLHSQVGSVEMLDRLLNFLDDEELDEFSDWLEDIVILDERGVK